MKEQDKIVFLLQTVKENHSITKEKLKEISVTRGVCKEEELEQLLTIMQRKSYLIILDDGQMKVIIPDKEFQKISGSKLAQTFINGGSTDKMIFTPPNTLL